MSTPKLIRSTAAAVELLADNLARSFINSYPVQLIAQKTSTLSQLRRDDRGNPKNIRYILDKHCPSLTHPLLARMSPTPFLTSGEQHSYYCVSNALKRDNNSDVAYNREIRTMSDNGTISLDWYPSRPSDRSDPTPIVIALTGIGGSSYEYHIRCLAKTLATQEEGKCSRLVVMNYRGASKTPLTTGKLYNAHDTNDYRNIVANISQQFPNAPLIGAGFSLGANLLTRYLGEQGSDSPLTAAISVCNPFDMSALGDAISANTAFNENVFHPVVTSAVKRMFVKNQSIIKSSPIGFDYDAVMKAKTTSELFLLALAKAYNFKDCQDYFHFASSTNYIHNIKTPFLAINTLDDHIAPASALPVRAIQENPYTALALLEKGGHLGLFCGVDSKIWYLNPMAEFVNGAIASKKIL